MADGDSIIMRGPDADIHRFLVPTPPVDPTLLRIVELLGEIAASLSRIEMSAELADLRAEINILGQRLGGRYHG